MSEVEAAAPKKTHSSNDNCQNCIRQRKQNETYIKIYERVQQISQKTYRVRQAVQDHKISSDTNRSFFKTFEEKVVSLPKTKKEVNSQLLQNVGFELAAGIVEKESKKKVVEENERLKKMINQMRKAKWQQAEPKDFMNSSCFTQKKSYRPNDKLQRTYNSCQSPQPKLSQTQILQNLLLSNESQQNYDENTTQSSSFQQTPIKKATDLSKYNDLNLWLYQSQKNTKLQEQLYVPGRSQNRSFISKTKSRNLPSIRSRK